MKKVLLLLFALLMNWQINAQVTTITNPDSGTSVIPEIPYQNRITFNNKYYCAYTNASNKVQLSEFDGNTISLKANPDNGYGYIKKMIIFNNQLFYFYPVNSGKYVLAKYDGTNVSTINNPDGGEILSDITPIVKGSYLYFAYLNQNSVQKLARYDGTTIDLFNLPTSATNIYNLVIFNNDLFFLASINSKVNLVKFDGSSTTVYTNPDTTGNIAVSDSFAILNSKLYFLYNDSNNTKTFLIQFDGTTHTIFANPDTGSGFVTGIKPVVCNNKLYYVYTDSSFKGRLIELNNATFTLITNPDSGFVRNFNIPLVVLNNEIFFHYYSSLSKDQLGKFNGTTISLINNPDNGNGVDTTLTVFDNTIFSTYSNANGKGQLSKYDGTSLVLIPNLLTTDLGMRGSPLDVFGNKLVFKYTISQGFFGGGVAKLGVYSLPCTPPTITSNITNKSLCNGGSTSFSIAATNATSYKWQVNEGSNFNDIPASSIYSNVNTATLTINNASSVINGYTYRCVVSNGSASCFTNSANATLTINPIPAAPTATLTQNFCSSSNPEVGDIVVTGTSIRHYTSQTAVLPIDEDDDLVTATYYISQIVNGCESTRTVVNVTVIPNSNNITTISSCGSYTWAINNQTYTTSGTYTGTTTNCITEKLNLTINAIPTMSSVTSQTICNNNTTSAVSFSGTTGTTFDWTNSNSSIGLASSGSGTIPSFSATNATTTPIMATITVTPINDGTININAPSNMISYSGNIGKVYKMTLTGNSSSGLIWGTNVYTDDSRLARAVVHAGILANGQTGTVYVEIVDGLSIYPSSFQNGINSSSWGSYCCSYRFVSAPPINPPCSGTPITFSYTVNPSSDNVITISSCGSYTWANNNQTYTTSGIYNGTTANCVTQKLNLTITPNSDNTTTISSCGSYIWANNSQTYTTSGTYTGTTSNCITQKLNLTIENPELPLVQATQTFCSNNNPTVGSLSVFGNGTKQYYDQAIGGTALSVDDALSSGTYYISNSIGNCESARVATNVTITQGPDAQVITFNNNELSVPLQAGASYVWYIINTNNFSLVQIGTGYSASISQTGTYRVEITYNDCTFITGKTITELSPAPEILTTTNGEGCQDASITVSATATAGSIISWYYQDNNSNLILSSSSVSFDELPVGVNTIYVQAALNNQLSDFVPVTITVNANSSSSTSVTSCGSYNWSANNQTYTESGVYSFTEGCETFELDLTVNQPISVSQTETACGGYTWSVNNQDYFASGTYTFTEDCTDYTLDLTINPVISTSQTVIACDSYTWDLTGETYTESGTYIFEETCGSSELDLTINTTTISSRSETACGSFTWTANNQTYTESGNYTFTEGCDTFELELTITPIQTATTTTTACGGYTWSVNNQDYFTSGTYTATIGCTNYTLDLTINPIASSLETITACSGYTWSVNNLDYFTSGTYTTTIDCTNYTLDLTINPIINSSENVSACDSYTWGVTGQTYTESGTYIFEDTCGSSELDLTINTTTISSRSETACGSFTWTANNQTYTESGNYTFTEGCDTFELNLIINQPTNVSQSETACGGYTWSVNNQDYFESGTYTATIGCVNYTLELTINTIINTSQTVVVCDTYTWEVTGQTYTESGNYTFNNTCGVSELDLTINQSTNSSQTETACGSYFWDVTGITYESSGTYVFNGLNNDNCSNTETLILTVNQPTNVSQSETACGGFTWSLNEQTYFQSGIYTSTIDCTEYILDLTINPIQSSSETVITCNSFTWEVNNQTYTTSGIYSFVDGCMTRELDLTIDSIDSTIVNDGLTLNANQNNALYQWIDCDNNNLPIDNATLQNFTPTQSGNYAVQIENGGCEATSVCTPFTVLSNTSFNTATFSYFPNPTSSLLNLKYSDEISEVTVYNILGLPVITKKCSSNDVKVDMTSLPAQTYLMKVVSRNLVNIIKVIKE